MEVLLTAHYDGVGDHPGLRQPGAADNAPAAWPSYRRPPGSSPAPCRVGLSVAFPDGAGRLHQAAAVEAGGPAHGLLAALDQAGTPAYPWPPVRTLR